MRMRLTPELRQEEGQQDHEADLAHLAQRHLARGLGPTRLVQEEVGEGVVELERNAEQERPDDERREGAVLHEAQGIEPEHVADAERLAGRVRRRVRQQEREESQRHRCAGGDAHGDGGRLEGQRPNHESRHDPADGAEHANEGKLLRGVLDVVERDGVRQRQRGHVAERVGDEDGVEGAECRERRGVPEEGATGEVEDAENLLGGEEAIGDHAKEERRHDGTDGHGAVRCADLDAVELECGSEECAECYEPGAPDEVLEEHHDRRVEFGSLAAPRAWSVACACALARQTSLGRSRRPSTPPHPAPRVRALARSTGHPSPHPLPCAPTAPPPGTAAPSRTPARCGGSTRSRRS